MPEPAMTNTEAADSAEILTADELLDVWSVLSAEERVEGFLGLPREEAEHCFDRLPAPEQAELLRHLALVDRRLWLRQLDPDDAADVIQEAPEAERGDLLGLLDETTRREVSALLAYAEDDAGGLMNPRFARVRPEMSVDEAITYLRRQARERLETIYYLYVLDPEQRLLGVVSFRDLFSAPPDKTIREVMSTNVVAATEDMDQEDVSRLVHEHGYLAIPVLDGERRVKGIVTVDDVLDVVQEEVTEDFHRIAATGVMPSLAAASLGTLYQKRVGWLLLLVFVNVFAGAGIAYFEETIVAAVTLVFFLPLLIDSAGNAGSQSATLMVRALATGDVRVGRWTRLLGRELAVALALGLTMAAGVAVLGIYRGGTPIAAVVASTMVLVVLVGSVIGMLLPIVLSRLGLDPATASAPLITSIADIVGVLLYFSVAKWYLGY
jgi:magnesium transporter